MYTYVVYMYIYIYIYVKAHRCKYMYTYIRTDNCMCTAEPLLVIVTAFGTVIVIVALSPAAQLLAGTPEEAASEGRSSQGEGRGS